MSEDETINRLTMTADIVSAYVGNNNVSGAEVPNLIASVHNALATLGSASSVEPQQTKVKGMVTLRKSLADPLRIISMIDGQPYAMLTRHIKGHGYTPQSYRQAFGLPADYPMTAPAYSDRRRELAQAIGLGRKKPVVEAPAPKTRRAATKSKAS